MATKWCAALAVVLGLSACADSHYADPPEVALVSLVPTDMSLMEQGLAVRLKLYNPNNAPMPLDGLRFTVEVNGRTFAKGMSDQRVTVPRLGEVEVTGKARVSTTDLVRQLAAAPEAKGLKYTLSGTVFMAGQGDRNMDFEQSGDFDFAQALGGGGPKGN
jgi:LEA14-like dessication related protein